MFKHLTLAFCAGALFTGCVITTGDSTDTFETDTGNVPQTDTGTTADVVTTGGTSAATETAEGTTAEPETTAPTTGEPATETTAETGNTTGTPPLYGMCGWFESDVSYYACVEDGGVAAAEDPLMENAIACPEGAAAGDPCTVEEGPVTGVGCCTADGHLLFCDDTNPDMPVVFDQDCG